MEQETKKEKPTLRTVKDVAAELEKLSLIVENFQDFTDTQNRINVKVLGMLASLQMGLDAVAKQANKGGKVVETPKKNTPFGKDVSISDLFASAREGREEQRKKREEEFSLIGLQNEPFEGMHNDPSFQGMMPTKIKSLPPTPKRKLASRKPKISTSAKDETVIDILKRLRQWYASNPQKGPVSDRKYTIVKWFELMPMEPRFIDGEEIKEADSLIGVLPLMNQSYARKLIEANRKDIEKYLTKSKSK